MRSFQAKFIGIICYEVIVQCWLVINVVHAHTRTQKDLRKKKEEKIQQPNGTVCAKPRHCKLRVAMALAAIFNLPFCPYVIIICGVHSVIVVVAASLLIINR